MAATMERRSCRRRRPPREASGTWSRWPSRYSSASYRIFAGSSRTCADVIVSAECREHQRHEPPDLEKHAPSPRPRTAARNRFICVHRLLRMPAFTQVSAAATARRRRTSPSSALGLARLELQLFLLRLQLVHELSVPGLLDDPVELRAVVRHEADALDHDIVRAPAVTFLLQPVFDGNLGVRLRDQLGPDRRLVSLDRLPAYTTRSPEYCSILEM